VLVWNETAATKKHRTETINNGNSQDKRKEGLALGSGRKGKDGRSLTEVTKVKTEKKRINPCHMYMR
jgi:hypothetical protein